MGAIAQMGQGRRDCARAAGQRVARSRQNRWLQSGSARVLLVASLLVSVVGDEAPVPLTETELRGPVIGDADAHKPPRTEGYYCKYQGYIGNFGCNDFRSEAGDAASSLQSCTSEAPIHSDSGLNRFLTQNGVENSNTRCWTCGGYNDLIYYSGEQECVQAATVLRMAFPACNCMIGHLFGERVYLLFAGCTDDLADSFATWLDSAASAECSGHGTKDPAGGSACVCAVGWFGDICSTTVL